MTRTPLSTPARLAFAVLGVAVAVVALHRGNHLLGLLYGAGYALTAALLVAYLALSRTPDGRWIKLRVVTIIAVALPLGYVLAFPARVNPDVQVFIDKYAVDRAARAELAALFDSDPAFRELWVSTVHLKAVNVVIRGRLPTHADLFRLRARVVAECPAVGRCALHWDVTLADSDVPVAGLDRDLFGAITN